MSDAIPFPRWKRALDLVMLALCLPIAVPLIIGLAAGILIRDGRPVFFVARRGGVGQRSFEMWKLRTLPVDTPSTGLTTPAKQGCSGLGAWLRATHLDELPQLWNILRGEISFVGPRPPCISHADAITLRIRPGLTGLATLALHRIEPRLLAEAHRTGHADAFYRQRLLPRKRRLDAIYADKASLKLDVLILFWSACDILGLHRLGQRCRRWRPSAQPAATRLFLARKGARIA